MVSIIMSTFREYESGLLQQAIYSVWRQTYPEWELIIIGDGTPGADQIKRLLARTEDNRIKFINLRQHAGLKSPGTIPKIEGVKKAAGNLLGFLDADNLYLPQHLERCVKAFRDDPRLDLVYGNTIVKTTNYQLLITNYLSFKWKKPDWNEKRQKLLMTSNFLDMSEPLFTRQAYFDAGGLDPNHHASDWLLWKNMIAAGHNRFKHLDHFGLIYHTTNLKHYLQYFGLMLMQKTGLKYRSEKLNWLQRSIKKRFKKKHEQKLKA